MYHAHELSISNMNPPNRKPDLDLSQEDKVTKRDYGIAAQGGIYPRPLFQIERESRLAILGRWFGGICIGLLATMLLISISLRWIDPPFTAFMIQHKWMSWQRDQDTSLDYRWVDTEQMSPAARWSVIAAEDPRFYEHGGFDFIAIRANMLPGTGEGDERYSTLTQQLARNLFLWSDRSWLRKVIEAIVTVALEVSSSKERILTLYLNTAEFGHGIFGIESAAQHFYGKSARLLTPSEAAGLAAVIPRPGTWSPLAPNSDLSQRIGLIQERMQRLMGQQR